HISLASEDAGIESGTVTTLVLAAHLLSNRLGYCDYQSITIGLDLIHIYSSQCAVCNVRTSILAPHTRLHTM
ncbi:MAG: hypothetical protein ACK55Z_12975, partial [bacterium]